MAARRSTKYLTLALLLAAALLTLGLLLFAQGAPLVTAVDPSSGKVNDTVTVPGENLGKGTVSATKPITRPRSQNKTRKRSS
jgi:hypothetical protein